MNKDKVVVIFEVKPKKEGMGDYLAHAANLKSELSKMEGFISAERFSSLNEEGKLLSLSVWENEESAAKWRNHIAHRNSQQAGHDSLFEKYHITVVSVIREYTIKDRTEAPQDSNDYLESKENELKIIKRLTGAHDNRIEVSEIGWTSRVYIIDGGKIVFKFPRNAQFREECKQEIAMLELIKEQNFSLSVPILNWVAEDNSYFGFYGVEGKPLGTVIDGLSERQKIEIGTQLGGFLKQLHSIKNYGDIKAQTLEEQVEEYQDWYRKDRDLLKDFFGESDLKKIDHFFACEVPKCMTGTGELVLCHGDLDYNNTLINGENRVGVIDFGDARLYDRSQDFRGMDDEVLREAMIRAYGDGEVISKEAAEATSKMIDVLNMLYCIEQKDLIGINDYLKRIRSKILTKQPKIIPKS